jgi:hypothetical protein
MSINIYERCVALTGSFETSLRPPRCFGKVSASPDRILTFGALGLHLTQGHLTVLVRKMDPEIIQSIWGEDTSKFMDLGTSTSKLSALSMQEKYKILPKYEKLFMETGMHQSCIDLQVAQAKSYYFQKAICLAEFYGIRSERGLAMMFDIIVQNHKLSISKCHQKILANFNEGILESYKLKIIAKEFPKYSLSYLATLVRKQTIANGEGVVNGIHYSLDDLTLNDYQL